MQTPFRSPPTAFLALVLAASACGARGTRGLLRQQTASYQFEITTPATPPAAADDVTYTIFVRDRQTGQPIEAGEGRVFARAGESIASNLVKAPQVGLYRATVRFPRAAEWRVGLRFRANRATGLELTQWVQDVRSNAAGGTSSQRMHLRWLPWRRPRPE